MGWDTHQGQDNHPFFLNWQKTASKVQSIATIFRKNSNFQKFWIQSQKIILVDEQSGIIKQPSSKTNAVESIWISYIIGFYR